LQSSPDWFVVRTKPHKELLVYNELRRRTVEAFVPLLKAPLTVFGRLTWVRAPLFPCYLFARFEADAIFKVRNTRGVREIVSSDNEPSAVPESVIEDLKGRCVDGVVELRPQRFRPNEPVEVKGGALHGWDAVLERYLSADERVAILLRTVETTGVLWCWLGDSFEGGESRNGMSGRWPP
jgi:transcriptional antiterminator RfaH